MEEADTAFSREQEEGLEVTPGGGSGRSWSTEQQEGAQVTTGGGSRCSFE